MNENNSNHKNSTGVRQSQLSQTPTSPRSIQNRASSSCLKPRLEMSNKSDFLSNMSVPNDELASQNLITDPEEIEDSQASDYATIKRKNEVKRGRQPQVVNYEGGQNGPNDAVVRQSTATQDAMQDKRQFSNGRRKKGNKEVRIRFSDGVVDHQDVQVTEKDNLQMSLDSYFEQQRPYQMNHRSQAVRVDLNCSVASDETPQPLNTQTCNFAGVNIEEGGIDLSASLQKDSNTKGSLGTPQYTTDKMLSELVMSQKTRQPNNNTNSQGDKKQIDENKLIKPSEEIMVETARTETGLVVKDGQQTKTSEDLEAQIREKVMKEMASAAPAPAKNACLKCLLVVLIALILITLGTLGYAAYQLQLKESYIEDLQWSQLEKTSSLSSPPQQQQDDEQGSSSQVKSSESKTEENDLFFDEDDNDVDPVYSWDEALARDQQNSQATTQDSEANSDPVAEEDEATTQDSEANSDPVAEEDDSSTNGTVDEGETQTVDGSSSNNEDLAQTPDSATQDSSTGTPSGEPSVEQQDANTDGASTQQTATETDPLDPSTDNESSEVAVDNTSTNNETQDSNDLVDNVPP